MLYDEVLSAIQHIRGGITIPRLSSRRQLGERRSWSKGHGHDLAQFTEYDPTVHSVHQIVWTMRPGWTRVYARESHLLRDFPILLLTDLSSSVESGVVGVAEKQRLLLEVAGIIGLTSAHNRDRVGLIGFAEKVLFSIRPRSGEANIYYLISQLCKFFEKAGVEPRKTDLWAAIDFANRNFRDPCIIIVLSDFIGCEEIVSSHLLRSHHEFIFIVLDDPKELAFSAKTGTVSCANIETGEKTAVSLNRIAELRKYIEEHRSEFQKALGRRGIDSLTLSYGSHFEALARFLAERRQT